VNFLQGAVYCWCKNQPNKRFALRDLMGGDNSHWEGTPLIVLYEKYANANDNDSVKSTGIDAGY
jgi:hypothetical protein